MSLTDAIVYANQKEIERNEQALASCFPLPPIVVTGDNASAFAQWCEARGVRFCPARPSTVAAFITWQRDLGVSAERIQDGLAEIEKMHDALGHANPVQTALVRSLLGAPSEIKLPRSWRQAEQEMFDRLPEPIKAVISRREQERETALRKCQNQVAELKRQTTAAPVDSEVLQMKHKEA